MMSTNNSQSSLFHIVLIGCPGSGKTTQSQKIVNHWTPEVCFKYEMGALMKQFAHDDKKNHHDDDDQTNTRQLISQLIQQGKLKTQVPVEIIDTVWRYHLAQLPPTVKLCLYYGGPMTIEEARQLIVKPDLVIVLQCENDQILVDRVCNRRVDTATGKTYHLIHDRQVLQQMNILNDKQRLRCRLGDDEILFRQRLTRFKKRSEPIVQFYETVLDKDKVIRIDASQSAEQIHELIKGCIEAVVKI